MNGQDVLRYEVPSSRLQFVDDLAQHGERAALLTDQGVVTYAALAHRVKEIGRGLGDTRRLILVGVDDSLEAIVQYLGAISAGHVVLLAAADSAVCAGLIAVYDPDVVVRITDGIPERTERRVGTAHRLHPDLALLLSTSGSTGSPKLVRLSATNLTANAEAIAVSLGLGQDDRAVTTLPLHYCYGLSVLHSHLTRGASVVVSGLSVVDDCFWELMARHSVTNLAGVPHTFDLLDRVKFEQKDLPSLRFVTQAGGRMAPEMVKRYAELGARRGWNLVVMYGQTEATARMACLPPHLAQASPGAIGLPVPGGTFTLEPCADTEDAGVGELVYRGPNVMMGYAEGPADLARGPELDGLATGDLGRLRPDGLYEIVGRASRFLKLYGLRIDLDRVEAVLGDRDIAATCTGDDIRLVVAVATPAAATVARHVVQERFGLPAGAIAVMVVEALPRLATGKVDHQALVRLAVAASPPPATAGGTPAAIGTLYAQALGRAEVDPQATFVGLGGDSLSYVEVSIGLEQLLGRVPSDWPATPISGLVAAPRPTRLPQLETGIALRAVAIVLVVGSHVRLFDLRGGAHILLAVAGFNFARFQLGAVRESGHVKSLVRGIAHLAALTLVATVLLTVVSDGYGWPNLAFVNAHFGPRVWDSRWRFWYVEALVQFLAVAAVALSSARIRALERRRPLAVAAGVLTVALALRFGAIDRGTGILATHRPQSVLWIFALGWAAERAATTQAKVALTAAIAVGLPGFFGQSGREALVGAGLAALLWIPTIPIVAPLRRAASGLAGASLSIYLVHWFIYRKATELTTPFLALAICLGAGLTAHSLGRAVGARWRRVPLRAIGLALVVRKDARTPLVVVVDSKTRSYYTP